MIVINCVCHSIRSMFRVLCIYNFDVNPDFGRIDSATGQRRRIAFITCSLKFSDFAPSLLEQHSKII